MVASFLTSQLGHVVSWKIFNLESIELQFAATVDLVVWTEDPETETYWLKDLIFFWLCISFNMAILSKQEFGVFVNQSLHFLKAASKSGLKHNFCLGYFPVLNIKIN